MHHTHLLYCFLSLRITPRILNVFHTCIIRVHWTIKIYSILQNKLATNSTSRRSSTRSLGFDRSKSHLRHVPNTRTEQVDFLQLSILQIVNRVLILRCAISRVPWRELSKHVPPLSYVCTPHTQTIHTFTIYGATILGRDSLAYRNITFSFRMCSSRLLLLLLFGFHNA